MKIRKKETLLFDNSVGSFHLMVSCADKYVKLRIGYYDKDCSSRQLASFKLKDEQFKKLSEYFQKSSLSLRLHRSKENDEEAFYVEEFKHKDKEFIRVTGKRDIISQIIGIKV